MITPEEDRTLQDFIESTRLDGATPTEIKELCEFAARTPRKMRGKVRELGIFTIGIGVIFAVLMLWLTFASPPAPGQQRSPLHLIVPLVIAAVYVVLGILVQKLRTPGIIILTMILVAAGFAIDLIIGFNIVKTAFDVIVISLIVKTGREALKEVKPEPAAE